MNRLAHADTRPEPEISDGLFRKIHWAVFGLFIAGLLGSCIALMVSSRSAGGELEAGLIVVGALTTLISMSRKLPGQNVLFAAIIAAIIGGAAHAIGAVTGVPFGPFIYTETVGPQLFHVLPWAIPFIWIIVILNSRGVARLILRPWRKTRVYGFWVIGLTAALALLFDLGLEPFATRVKGFWLWGPTKLEVDWHGAPVTNFLGWMLTALLIPAFSTPFLINKKPVRSSPDYHPLIVWVLFNVLFATGAATRQLWTAAGFSVAASVVVIVFALRGARW